MEQGIVLNNFKFTRETIPCFLITSLISFHIIVQLLLKASLQKIITFKNNSDFMANL